MFYYPPPCLAFWKVSEFSINDLKTISPFTLLVPVFFISAFQGIVIAIYIFSSARMMNTVLHYHLSFHHETHGSEPNNCHLLCVRPCTSLKHFFSTNIYFHIIFSSPTIPRSVKEPSVYLQAWVWLLCLWKSIFQKCFWKQSPSKKLTLIKYENIWRKYHCCLISNMLSWSGFKIFE